MAYGITYNELLRQIEAMSDADRAKQVAVDNMSGEGFLRVVDADFRFKHGDREVGSLVLVVDTGE